MELENGSNLSTVGSLSCDEHKLNLTGGLKPYQILVFLNPVDSRIWTERDAGWRGAFKVYAGLLGSMYLLLGLISVVLLIKKDCVRLRTKTFFAVYSTIAILGFSRSLLLALDPYDLLGFISEQFQAWIIISRILGSLGFPSLVASYTLMVFTLLKIAKANPGKKWYHRWRFVIPIVVVPYVIAIGAEVIGYIAEYPGLLSVIICEIFFSLWGVTVCITYLIAGGRLMHQLRKRERNTVRMSSSAIGKSQEDPEESRQTDFATQEYERHHRHNRRTARKIAIITYGTVLVALLYSLFSIGNIIMISLFLFHDCLGFMEMRGNSIGWLVLHISTRITEVALASIMLYSITDVQGVMKVIARMFKALFCCKRMRVTECSSQTCHHPLTTGRTLNNTTSSQMNMLAHSHDNVSTSTDDLINTTNRNTITTTTTESVTEPDQAEMRTEITVEHGDDVFDSEDPRIHLEATVSGNKDPLSINDLSLNVPRTFLLNASQGESSSSIESCIAPTTLQEDSQYSQTSKQHSAAPIHITVQSRTNPETSEREVQAERHVHVESLGETEEKQVMNATSLENAPEQVKTLMVESGTQNVEANDKACQTEPAPGGNKPVPKPRRFAQKSPRERRQKLRDQAQLPQTSISSKLKRKQTV